MRKKVSEEPVLTFEQKVAWDIMRKFPLCVELPGHPPSINSLYSTSRSGHRFKTKKGKDWDDLMAIKIKSAARSLYGTYDLSFASHRALDLEFSFFRDSWKCKGRDVRHKYVKKDVSNFIKVLEDCLCKSLGLEDEAVVSIKAIKSIGLVECSKIQLTFVGL